MVSECINYRDLCGLLFSLNPCFSGGWSRRQTVVNNGLSFTAVLILVLVEDGLGESVQTSPIPMDYWVVLILVLVEDGLGACLFRVHDTLESPVLILVLVEDGLGARFEAKGLEIFHTVLILVLVEDGLGGEKPADWECELNGLNPCFSGGWSRRPTPSCCPKST